MDIEQFTSPIVEDIPNQQPDSLNQIIQMMDNITVTCHQNKLSLQQVQALRLATQNSDDQCSEIVQKGVIPIFISLLQTNNLAFIEQAFYAIGNIACTSMRFRQSIINIKGIQLLIEAIKNVSSSQENINLGLWAISNVCRGSQIPQILLQKMIPGVHFLCSTIINQLTDNEQTLIDCLASIHYTLAQNKNKAHLLIDWGFIPSIFQFFYTHNIRLKTVALKIIGTLISFRDQQLIDLLFYNSAISQICDQINCPNLYIRKRVCSILSHVAAGPKTNVLNFGYFQIEKLFQQPQLLQKILNLFRNDNLTVRKEICYFFSNLCTMQNPQSVMSTFNKYEIVSYFLDFIGSFRGKNDIKSIQYTLVGLESLHKILVLGQLNTKGSSNFFVTQIVQQNGTQILMDLMGLSCENVKTSILKIQTFFSELSNQQYRHGIIHD